MPTLFVHAADDRLAPYERVEPAVNRVPNAHLVTIESGGHSSSIMPWRFVR